MKDLAAIRLAATPVVGVLVGLCAVFELYSRQPFTAYIIEELIFQAYLVLLLIAAIGTIFVMHRARLALSVLLVVYACACATLAVSVCISECRDWGRNISGLALSLAIQALITLVVAWVVYPSKIEKSHAS